MSDTLPSNAVYHITAVRCVMFFPYAHPGAVSHRRDRQTICPICNGLWFCSRTGRMYAHMFKGEECAGGGCKSSYRQSTADKYFRGIWKKP